MICNKTKIVYTLVFFLTFSFTIQSQNKFDEKPIINFFDINENTGIKTKYLTSDINGEILNLDPQKLTKFIKSDFKTFIFKLTIKGKVLNLRMQKSNFIVEGAKCKTIHSEFETDLASRGLHYWGSIVGDDYGESIITFSFYNDEIIGYVFSNLGNYSLLKLNEQPNTYALYESKTNSEDLICVTEDEFPVAEIKKNLTSNLRSTSVNLLDYPIEISMNANNCVIHDGVFGTGSVQTTIDKMLGHFNFYSLIFANEEITIKLSEIVLEDLGPNGVGLAPCSFAFGAKTDFYGPGMTTTNGCAGRTSHYLEQFQNNLGNSYVGDYAYMYVNSSCYAAGRAASLGAFCNSSKTSRMAVGLVPKQDLTNYELPNNASLMSLFPHELGHLLGASHNYCSSTPYFNIMLSGGGSCLNVDENFRRGFGVTKGNVIRNNILNNLSCFEKSDTCEQEDLYIFHRIEDLGTEDYSAYYKASNIVADNLILNNSEALYAAESEIVLIPGFEVEENSEFEARIEDCSTSNNRESYTSNDQFSIVNDFLVIPTAVENMVLIENRNKSGDQISIIRIYNLFGVEVFKGHKINTKSVSYNLRGLSKGFYILKVIGIYGEILHTQKIVKK